MAKQATKRPASKPNKKNHLSQSFSLQSKKVQFFVVIAIIAILGGGYYTIKSFASTTPIFTASNFGVPVKTESVGNKAGTPYIDVTWGGTTTLNTYNNPKNIAPGTYFVCSLSRAPQSVLFNLGIHVNNRINGSQLFEGSITPAVGTTYTRNCTNNSLTINENTSVFVDVYPSWSPASDQPSGGSIFLSDVSFTPVSSQPPAPVK